MNNLVLYGAGANGVESYVKFAKEGHTPVCICDSDPAKIGQIARFAGGVNLTIISFDEALIQYPDAVFYVTPDAPVKFEIMDKLQRMGIEKSRIVNFEPYMLTTSCPYLESQIHFSQEQVMFCCVYFYDVKVPQASLSLSNEDLLNTLSLTRQESLSAFKHNTEREQCAGCPEIKKTYISVANNDKWKLKKLLFGAGTVCNLDCIYCETKKTTLIPWNKRLQYLERAIDFIKYLQEREIIDQATRAVLGGGEISIHPLKTDILQLFKENPCQFLTNAVVYSEEVENVLKNGKSRINISLDSGTPTTYRQIKGGGDFYTTLDNIRRYSKFTNIVDLKYILIPGKNYDTANIDGFLNFAEEINANVILSRDFFGIEDFEKDIDGATQAIAYFKKSAAKRGVNIYMSGHMSISERKEKIRRL